MPLSKLHFSPTLLFSPNAIPPSYHSMLSHPPCSCSQETPSNPWRRFCHFCVCICLHNHYIRKKISLSRFYPLLITYDTSRDEKSNACQNAGPLVSFEEETPRCFAFFVFFALPLTLVKSHRQIILSSKRKKM